MKYLILLILPLLLTGCLEKSIIPENEINAECKKAFYDPYEKNERMECIRYLNELECTCPVCECEVCNYEH